MRIKPTLKQTLQASRWAFSMLAVMRDRLTVASNASGHAVNFLGALLTGACHIPVELMNVVYKRPTRSPIF